MSQNPEPHDNIITLQKQKKMFTAPVQYQKRRRTDVFCTYLGLLFIMACIGLSYALKKEENVLKVKYPSDSSGKICGVDYPEHPFLYMTSLPDISQRLCVAACPAISDLALKCKATADLSCDFSASVQFSDTKAQQDHNGKMCMPADANIRKQFIKASKLEERVSFLNPIVLRIYEITIALSVLLVIALQFLPRTTMEAVQYLSLATSITLIILVHINPSDQSQAAAKQLLTVFLGVTFLTTLSQIIIFRHQLKVNRVFIAESSRLITENKGLALYILFFEIILGAFMMLVLEMYSGLASYLPPSFDANASLYYQINAHSSLIALTVLAVFGIWGLSIIQQLSSFCISSHTVNFYFKLPNDCASVVYTFRLLFGKHLGSVVGGAFVNGLFFLPQAVLDLVRSCRNSKIKTNFCFFNAIDLARADAMSLIIISGTPYCNASKYCEYLWNESMTTDQTQSSIRVFKLAAHVFIANVGSLIGLLLRGDMDPYLLAFTQVVGLFISTFFIEFNAVSSQTLQLISLMQEEFFKRREGRVKQTTNVLNRGDQKMFLSQVNQIFSNQEVANEIRQIRMRYWSLEEELANDLKLQHNAKGDSGHAKAEGQPLTKTK